MRILFRVLTVFGLIAIPFQLARAVSSSVVVSQVFAGNDNSNGYVELFNIGSSPVNLRGWSLQYGGKDGSSWTKVSLTGTILPSGYYLVRASGGSGSSAVYDAFLSVQLDASAGQLALLNIDTSLTQCPTSGGDTVVDFLGYGEANCSESSRAASMGSSRTALYRLQGGCIDTDRNREDFIAVDSPSPRSSSYSRNPCSGTLEASRRSLPIPQEGGLSIQSTGTAEGLIAGSAKLEPSDDASVLPGFAIFSRRDSRGIVNEATVPATPLITFGLFYISINGAINTGLAIVNPNDEPATINFSILESSGGQIRQGEPVTVAPNSQTAKFLTELPWGIAAPIEGTFVFSSTLPIGVVVLRGFTNQRGEFLTTTLPVVNVQTASSGEPAYVPHFAVNGGWKTEVLLFNSSPLTETGTLEFLDPVGQPVNVRVGSVNASSIDYSAVSLKTIRVVLNGTDGPVQIGSIRVMPSGGSRTPSVLGIFSFTKDGVTVSETGIAGVRGSAFRTYSEFSGVPGTPGSITSGFAVVNTGPAAADLVLDLFRLDGTYTGLSTTIRLQTQAQISKFLHELFPSLTAPFQGILRVTTTGTISLVGLRGRYNTNRDFLLTSTPPLDEAAAISSRTLFFPHIVDSGNYSTQFVILNRRSSGTVLSLLQFTTSGGRPLGLELR
jgi:hypothetical protein